MAEAAVTAYGGEDHTAQHWQLRVEGEFIADTSRPEMAALFERIAKVWSDAPDMIPKLNIGPLTDREIATEIIMASKLRLSIEQWQGVQSLIEAALEVKERQRRAQP